MRSYHIKYLTVKQKTNIDNGRLLLYIFIIIVFGSSVFPYCVTCRKPRHADITNRRGTLTCTGRFHVSIDDRDGYYYFFFFLLQKITYSRTVVHFVDFVSRNTTNKRTRPSTST